MSVVPIRKRSATPATKTVAANQKAVDELPFNCGSWRVEGVPGLYVRCRARVKSFRVERRIRGRLVKANLGPISVKRARALAMKVWSGMKAKPAAHEVVTLETAIEAYLAEKDLAPKTAALYKYNAGRYLKEWLGRGLAEIGEDRAGVRRLQRQITKDHGPATANQIVRLLSAVYRWQRKIDPQLPEAPTTAVEVARIPARDWALSADELRAWWKHEDKAPGGKLIARGVSTLGAIKRMWWLAALLTGARKGSIEALKWADVDLEKKILFFRVTKGDRPYAVPIADKLVELLSAYRDSGDVPPSEWVFPGRRDGEHLADVKNDKEGVPPAHRLRHSFRTVLAELGSTTDQARMLMGHSMGGDVSRGYITAPLLVESLRPIVNAVATRYMGILNW